MPISSKAFRFGPLALTATLTTNLLSPPEVVGGIGGSIAREFVLTLHHLSIINKTATPRTFSLWLGNAGANAAGTEVVGTGVTVAANDRFDYHGEIRMKNTDFLVGGASAATALTIMGEGIIEAVVGGDILRLDVATVSSFLVGGPSTAKWKLDLDGGVYWARDQASGGAFIKLYDWVTPVSSAPNYECTWTAGLNTVDVVPVAEGTYAALSATRTWEETNPTGIESCSFTARIRRIGGVADLVTALISMDVDGSP